MTHPVVSQVEYGSAAYHASVALRNEVLREPLGLSFTCEEQQQEKAHIHIVCEEDGELVGCLILVPLNTDEVKMRQVAVAPQAQGQGIGRALVGYAEEVAKAQGFAQITLHARATTLPFYEKLGYERVGEEFEEVTLPHWEMRKHLVPPLPPETEQNKND